MLRMAYFGLPTSNNDGASLHDVHAALQSTLIDTWGGFSAFNGLGGWRDDATSKIFAEPTVGYYIAMPDDAGNRAKLLSVARFYGHMAQQLAVMVTYANGDVEFVDMAKNALDAVFSAT